MSRLAVKWSESLCRGELWAINLAILMHFAFVGPMVAIQALGLHTATILVIEWLHQ